MTEHQLELRLQAVARSLDADAPAFDPALLGAAPRRRARVTIAVLAVVALAGVLAAPAAVSALRDLFEVERVPELVAAPDVMAPFEGRPVSPNGVAAGAPFPVRTIPSLGTPDAAFVRDDVMGGMVTVVYGAAALTQWQTADVDARLEVVPDGGAAEDVTLGAEGRPALWIEGAARGTFTVVGADGAIHRERFEVSPGALLWKDAGLAFLLQGAGSKADAVALAAAVPRA